MLSLASFLSKQTMIYQFLISKQPFSNIKRNSGYIALTSILVIAVVVLTIGISVALISISEGQISLAEKKKEETLDFVESCVEDALLRLNKDENIPSQIKLPEGTCSVNIESQVDNKWVFTVSGQLDNYRKTIKVMAVRGSKINVESWQEVE